VAEAVAGAVASGSSALAYRSLIQLADDLAAVDPDGLAVLTEMEPLSVGGRWDDAIAGIVELRLREAGVPVPGWVTARVGDPGKPWAPDHAVVLPLPEPDSVPEPLRRRGIYIEAGEFESV